MADDPDIAAGRAIAGGSQGAATTTSKDPDIAVGQAIAATTSATPPVPTNAADARLEARMTPGPPTPANAPGPPMPPPPAAPPSSLGLGFLGQIKAGLDTGVLAPGAQRYVESLPYVGPVLGEASRLAGGALAVPGAAFNALQGVVSSTANQYIPPNAGGPIGPSLAAGMEVAPFADMPGFRGPTDVPAGAEYTRWVVQNALDNRTVPLPQEFRAQPFAPDAAARVAQGPVAGPTEPTSVPPPPPGSGVGAPVPRPRLSVGPDPQSVGAAATPGSAIPDPTRAEALTNLERSVNQSAEDRAGPNQVDQTAYVPGIPTRPLASRVFTAQNALDEKVLRAKPDEQGGARDTLDAIDRDRNQGMVDILRKDAGDANTLEAAKEYRREAAPDQFGAFRNEQPVDASGLLKSIDDAMADPRAAKSKPITAALQEVRDSLFDKDGNLETMPSTLYGARQNLTDLLDRSKGVGDEAKKLQAATAILTKMVPDFDQTIGSGAPRYQLYMDEYRNRSQAVNQQEFLQKYTEGTTGNKITDSSGYLQLPRVQKLLNDILQEQKRTGTSPAKSLTDDQIQNIINVRNELAAGQLRDRKAAVKGSDTFQQLNQEAEKGSGPLATGLRAVGGMAAQAGMMHVMGLDPALNAAGLVARSALVPSLEAARARSRAATLQNALTARKQELLQQGPQNPLIPP